MSQGGKNLKITSWSFYFCALSASGSSLYVGPWPLNIKIELLTNLQTVRVRTCVRACAHATVHIVWGKTRRSYSNRGGEEVEEEGRGKCDEVSDKGRVHVRPVLSSAAECGSQAPICPFSALERGARHWERLPAADGRVMLCRGEK